MQCMRQIACVSVDVCSLACEGMCTFVYVFLHNRGYRAASGSIMKMDLLHLAGQ